MQIKTSPHNRKCKYPPCNNILSIYNHEEHCNVHLKASFWIDKVGGVSIEDQKCEASGAKVLQPAR